MHQQEFHRLLKKYKEGLCTPEEEILIDKWFKAMGSSEDTSLPARDSARLKQRSWTRVQQYIQESAKVGESQVSRKREHTISSARFWSIAAALLALIVSAVFLLVRQGVDRDLASTPQVELKSIANTTNGPSKVVLPDGSEVVLRPNSAIRFREPFDEAQRVVALEGEAFFNVSRNVSRPFLVNTKEVITKVLGTSFTVSAFPDDEHITVSVQTGKVSVITRKDRNAPDSQTNETILTPNQKIIYNKSNNLVSRAIVAQPTPVLPPDVVKRMQFEAAPIREIFEGLEQVYGVDIEFDEAIFSSCILTTSIAEGNIYNRLDMICKAIDAHYAIEENVIVVTGRGCGK